MDAYKKTVKLRMALLSVAAAAAACILAYGIFAGYLVPIEDAGRFNNFLAGFHAGMLGALIVIFIIFAVKQGAALADDAKLKRRYVEENDERTIMIYRLSGGFILQACSIIVLLAAAVSGYFSEQVFFSLLGCALFLCLARLGTKLYLSRKF